MARELDTSAINIDVVEVRPALRAHFLKCDPQPFTALLAGQKRHEVRSTRDREFRVGDLLVLQRSGALEEERLLHLVITYITPGGSYGLPNDIAVLSVDFLQFLAPDARATRDAVTR